MISKQFLLSRFLPTILIFLIVWLAVFPLSETIAADDPYIQLHGLIDIRSTFSDGSHDLDYLVKLSKDRGFDVVFIHDHDRMAMEYGVFPFRNIVRKKVEQPSVNHIGAQKYLNSIEQIQQRNSDILVMEGIESAPFYYWSGSLLSGEKLTANDWERHLLVMGLGSIEEYEKLPDIHNSYANTYSKNDFIIFAIFCATAVLGIFITTWKGAFRIVGGVLIVTGSLLAIDSSPLFSRAVFDQYHGPQGAAPYQALIDYVNEKGGLTFWNHMETKTGIRELPPIQISTPAYPEVLITTKEYTGFASIYGDNRTITQPGHEWDKLLIDYINGNRSKPIWGISTADYHEEAGQGTGQLGHYQTVFWVKERSRSAVLTAMRDGKMYASQGPYLYRPILSEFYVSDGEMSGAKAISGEEIELETIPVITFTIRAADDNEHKVKIRLIRAGKIIQSFDGVTPLTISYEDTTIIGPEKTYYRLDAKGAFGEIISNPIFVSKM